MLKNSLIFPKNDPSSRSSGLKIEKFLNCPSIQKLNRFQKAFKPSLIIVIGGDGTVLEAEKRYPQIPKLILGSGRLGFLSALSVEKWKKALELLRKDRFDIEKRLKLASPNLPDVLNEYALKGRPGKMFEGKIWADQSLIGEIRGDGILINTPTGSTAYALSAGSPLVYPTCENIVLTPINPFNLSSRPFVFSAQTKIEIQVLSPAQLFGDGAHLKNLKSKDRIKIKRSNHEALFVRFEKEDDFFTKLKLLR